MTKSKFRGDVFIEGSSVGLYGDEEYRGGFQGRLGSNYREGYWYRDSSERFPCVSVVVHANCEPDNTLPFFVDNIRSNVDRGLRPLVRSGVTSRALGIFILDRAVHPAPVAAFGGQKAFRTKWRNALERLAKLCDELRLEPILLDGPQPNGQTRFRNGATPDFEMGEEIGELNRRAAVSMEATHLSVQEMVGGEDQLHYYMSDDWLHLNAHGHAKVASGLACIIGERYSIPQEFGIFPEILGK